MKAFYSLLIIAMVTAGSLFAQEPFNYSVVLIPVTIPGLPGLHSYVFAQHGGKWLILGGRKDGIHARQPLSAFPQAQNNTTIYVVDASSKQVWSASVSTLPTGLAEQLQSTNMSFYQDNDTLYIVGGYAYSATAEGHMTFPYLSAVTVSSMIQAVINGATIASWCRQTTDDAFAVTGGQLGKIGSTFYLAGGHRFDGRYNPMGGASFTQAYTNQVRRFNINNSGTQLAFTLLSPFTDPIHLRRRDYNLIPQVFPDGSHGYTISSGVFQLSADLPFLYPVNISANGYTAVTTFNQYLSNYHCAKAALYDSTSNVMHTLFFGGISQYYYQGGTLIKDDNVPFISTISRLSRSANGSLSEYRLPQEMPALKGSGSEFIPNHDLDHYPSEILKLNSFNNDTILIGHIYGGIASSSLNPFTTNQSSQTASDNSLYEVKLVKQTTGVLQPVDGANPYDVEVFPNPVHNEVHILLSNRRFKTANYYVATSDGQIVQQGNLDGARLSRGRYTLLLDASIAPQTLMVTFIFDELYYVTKKIIKL
jgi:hypothetical protein